MLPNKTMATILNKQPVQSSKFDKFWLTGLNLIFPSETSPGLLIAKLHPYDGKYVLTSQPKHIIISDFSKESTDAALYDVVELVENEAERLHGFQESSLHSFKVLSNDPKRATVAFFNYVGGPNKHIEDCFAYAASDQQFGQNINTLLSHLAQLAKLPVIN
jgi:hypothetical protein